MAIEEGSHSQFNTDINNNNREFMMMNQWTTGGTVLYDTHMPYTNSFVVPIPAEEADDRELTCNDNNNHHMGLTLSRKRSRDCYQTPNGGKPRLPFSRLEHEAALQMQRQQRELDCFIVQQTQRLRVEQEERAKSLASVIRKAVSTKLREKDEEIQRVVKMNWALQERIRNLSVENQLWRGMAQSNEAAANSLRYDLERVLTGTAGAVVDQRKAGEEDAVSCCGSNDVEEESRRLSETWDEGLVVMPCRHVLLMCTRSELSSRYSCPVCRSSITSTLPVLLPPKSIDQLW